MDVTPPTDDVSTGTVEPYTPPGEHYVNWYFYDLGSDYDTLTADTGYVLETGGPPGSTHQNLWAISATAWDAATGKKIPYEQISIGTLGRLGSDGNLYVMLPDNALRDATPQVAGNDHYTFTQTSAQKYKLHILANGDTLASDRVRPNAHFCVGEFVNFTQQFSPSLPTGTQLGPILWAIDGIFVNDSWQNQQFVIVNSDTGSGVYEPYGSINYYKNNSLLNNESTSAWWLTGANPAVNYNVRLGEGLTFPNGQYVAVATKGLLSMYRPSLTNWNAFTPIPNAAIWGGQLNVGTEQSGGVRYTVDVNSIASGQAIITQVFDDGSYPASDNFGSDVLDKADAYPSTTATIYATPPAQVTVNYINYSDAPGNDLTGDSTSLVLNFRDYIRFEPANGPGPNIYVTLGKVTWNVDAWANLVGTTWQPSQNPPPTVSLPQLDPTSVEFPYWTSVH